MTADHLDRLFILHLSGPVLLAEVFHFENLNDEERMDKERHIFDGLPDLAWRSASRLDYPPETIFFRCIYCDNDFHSTDQQYIADQLAKIMRRMADWYKSYLIWEGQE